MTFARYANSMQEGSSLDTLKVLREAGVEFIVIGGVAASLYGAPGQTFDIDMVHAQDPANIERLLSVLQKLMPSTGFSRSYVSSLRRAT